MAAIRRVRAEDLPVLWTLAVLPNTGETAGSSAPLPLPTADRPPAAFADLADPLQSFIEAGGEFLVAEVEGQLAAMGGIRPAVGRPGRAEVLRVRVHPALRRRGIGRALMTELETSAVRSGFQEAFLDTATNQPEAMAFYQGLGYRETGRETRSSWTWTLVYYTKRLTG